MSAVAIERSPAVERLRERILDAHARSASLEIRGGGTKSFYGQAPRGEALELRELAGISSYEPSELVVTARAGTPLAELEAALAERGQCLAFEPPRFAPGGTVGGMVAAGLSGPARAAAGPLRDYVLGVTLLNGRAELLTFGGQVMKNVAGYDVSRLMAGAWGVLGILCEVSLKVMAARPQTATLEFAWDERRSLGELARWNALPLPINASAWHEGRLRVRLSGAAAAVASGCLKLGGARLDAGEAAAWWDGVRDHGHAFFRPSGARLAGGECLWRIAVPPTAPPLGRTGFIEWGGAQRWSYASAEAALAVRAQAKAAGGHATLVRAADKSVGAFAPLDEPLARIHRALKSAFDPHGVFNPGRLYADL
jgi:FAD/FMN-containing dehydrogenase